MYYLKLFQDHGDYQGFVSGDTMEKPNVSHCIEENEVHYNPIPDPYNGHAYVDLGLPSGTLWAKMNVGAQTETDYGLYFAWGETEGYADASTKAFSWDDYKYDPEGSNPKYYSGDSLINLDLEDDAAHVNMGGDWHMPNTTQCYELFRVTKNGFVTNTGAFTQYAWSDTNGYSSPTETTATISGWGTAGYFFFKNTYISVTDAITAEDYLFIPAAGYCEDGRAVKVGVMGRIWASALNSPLIEQAWGFSFHNNRTSVSYFNRFGGQSVRGVVGNVIDITPEPEK